MGEAVHGVQQAEELTPHQGPEGEVAHQAGQGAALDAAAPQHGVNGQPHTPDAATRGTNLRLQGGEVPAQGGAPQRALGLMGRKACFCQLGLYGPRQAEGIATPSADRDEVVGVLGVQERAGRRSRLAVPEEVVFPHLRHAPRDGLEHLLADVKGLGPAHRESP